MRALIGLLAAVLAGLLTPLPAGAMGFYAGPQPTLRDRARDARVILCIRPPAPPNNQPGLPLKAADETVEAVPEQVLKSHPVLRGSKVIRLPSADLSAAKGAPYLIVYCRASGDRLDPFYLIPDSTGKASEYLRKALALPAGSNPRSLRFFFDYLDSANEEISRDAFIEIDNADYKDFRAAVGMLPADRVAGWLEDPKTPRYRHGLYALMLGHCGTEKHATLLRSLLEKMDPGDELGVDRILAAYVMLKPREGWAFVNEILKDGKKDFMQRYAALRAVRFFHDSRPDLVPRKDLLKAMARLLEQGDIADLAIEDMRRWACWDMAGRVLALKDKPVYKVLLVRRAVLWFAVSCKGNTAADRFITEQACLDPQLINDIKDLLKLEQSLAAPTGK
jgi:hypothetical protein